MRIAVDLDGVCYEWERTVRYMLREYRGTQTVGPSQHWDDIQQQVSYGDWQWLWSEGVRLGLFRYGHMWKGARRGLQALHDRGHDLVVVTHRPESAVVDTAEWVAYHFRDIPLRGLNILSSGQPKTSVGWDLLVDDKPSNVREAHRAGREAILFDQPWNQETVAGYRARGWKDVVEWIDEIDSPEGRRIAKLRLWLEDSSTTFPTP